MIATTRILPLGVSGPSLHVRTPQSPPAGHGIRFTSAKVASFSKGSDGYSIFYPEGWVHESFVGYEEFRPSVEPAESTGNPTFAIHVSLNRRKAFDLTRADGMVSGRASTFRVAGGEDPSKTFSDQWQGEAYDVDWTGECSGCAHAGTLRLEIYASDTELFDTWLRAARKIIASLIPSRPSHRDGSGYVQAGMVDDGFSARLIDFLQHRVDGAGAEHFLSGPAKRTFDNSQSENLYGFCCTASDITSFLVVTRRNEVGAVSFSVLIIFDGAPHDPELFGSSETVRVGPGRNSRGRPEPFVIRAVSGNMI